MYIYFFFLRMCCISYCHGAAVGRGGRRGGQGAVTLAKPQIHPGAVNRGKAVM